MSTESEKSPSGETPTPLPADAIPTPDGPDGADQQQSADRDAATSASGLPEAQVDPAALAELEAEYRPKKKRWPMMVAAIVGFAALGVGMFVMIDVATKRPPKPSSEPDGGAIYGTSTAANMPAQQQGSSKPLLPLPGATQEHVASVTAQASYADALPGVGSSATRSAGDHSGVIEVETPQINTTGAAPVGSVAGVSSSSGLGANNEYGEVGGGVGDSASSYRSSSGRPATVPRSKEDKPEMYAEEVTPRAMLVSKRRAANSPARQGVAPQQEQAARLPVKGTILGGPQAAVEQEEPFAPTGRLVPCELVFAVDSLSQGAPLIALTTQDLVYDGRVIIPKNSEVFSRVGGSFFETESVGRIVDQGLWRIVMPAQPGQRKGRELVVHGRALTRRELVVEPSGRVRQWDRMADGSPGLFGRAITTRDKAEVKKALLDILKGVVVGVGQAQMDKENVQMATGGVNVGNASTLRNLGIDALTNGVSGLLDARTQAVSEQISRNGTYVAVDSGTAFYLYIEEPVLPASSQRGRRAAGTLEQQGASAPSAPALNSR